MDETSDNVTFQQVEDALDVPLPEPGIGDLVTAVQELNNTLYSIYLVLNRIEHKIARQT